MAAKVHDIEVWLSENKKIFQPPACVKLMFKDDQLKVFFVGGPNSRKDFHMEAGEEFFYMHKGDMNLVVYEKGKFKDVIIKEGEVFLLPRGIPHSPQRFPNTIGLVIEREREESEMDCLRYYVDGSDEILYEKWFYCKNLEALGPLIKEFFDSEQCRTGKPIPGTIPEEKPVEQDYDRTLQNPFNLKTWINQNRLCIDNVGKKKLFEEDYTSRIWVLGPKIHNEEPDQPETFLWQLEGNCKIKTKEEDYELFEGQTLLINSGQSYELQNVEHSYTLTVVMNPIS